MNISQKCQYALRAVFELAKRQGMGVTTIADVAAVQAIPPRFLEIILGQLRQGGFVESRRGVRGGYTLAKSPGEISAGDIIRFIDGPIAPTKCVAANPEADCPLYGGCPFMSLWARARDAVTAVYDQTSLQDLLDEEQATAARKTQTYCI